MASLPKKSGGAGQARAGRVLSRLMIPDEGRKSMAGRLEGGIPELSPDATKDEEQALFDGLNKSNSL